MNNATLYIDMDGVLARFEQAENAMKRFENEKGFFSILEPTQFAKKLKNVKMHNVKILTSSPNKQADNDKLEWIKKHLPQLKDNMVFVRSGQEKAKYAKGNFLLDDYTDNLKHWVEQGGIAIKALNGLNGKTKRYRTLTNKELRVD